MPPATTTTTTTNNNTTVATTPSPAAPGPVSEFRIFNDGAHKVVRCLARDARHPAEIGFLEYHAVARRLVMGWLNEKDIKILSRTVDKAGDGPDAAALAVYRLGKGDFATLTLAMSVENVLLDQGDSGVVLSRKKYAKYIRGLRQRVLALQSGSKALQAKFKALNTIEHHLRPS
jgi:hypothetical protein